MATYALIPGAGGSSWYWHKVAANLRAATHDVVSPDLPASNESARLADYVKVVLDAIGTRSDVIVVGQSLGAFTAPIVCDRYPARLLVLVAAMIPSPGETGGEWWTTTGQHRAASELALSQGRSPDEFDPIEIFLHDLPADTLREAMDRPVEQADGPFIDPWPLEGWPDVATRVVACRNDRLFPLEFMQRLSRDRLGIEPDIIDTGHLPALANPQALTNQLETYRLEIGIR
jgi:pimeloyl-ACP methyl ester carboxylesterase